MSLRSVLGKSSLLLASMFVLAACGSNESKEADTTTVAETTTTTTTAAETTKEESSLASSDSELQDGTYTLKSNEDERGWAVQFELTVKDGKITESKFDYVNAEGDLKSEDEGYNTAMKDKTDVSAAEAMETLNAKLVETQSVDAVDVVSGASHTSESFKEYATLLLEAAAKGDTNTIEVELPAE